jgi:iron only hydrogenase large subunit-like protein
MKKNEFLLSLSEVKNILKEQSKETLINLIIDSYKNIPQVKEYITAKYANQDTMEQIFEAYRIKVHDVFFPKSIRAQLKIGEARKAVNAFKKLYQDEKLSIDLMLYYVEMGVEFTNAYGDINESF